MEWFNLQSLADPNNNQCSPPEKVSGSDTACRKEVTNTDQADRHDSISSRRGRRTSSCQALKLALLTLYRLDDFDSEKLGQGFFSDVYKVTHRCNGQIMVLKMNTIEDNRPNMLREVQLMNKLSHPYILKFMGVCVHQGQLHALTEYINGGNLHDFLCNDKKGVTIAWMDRVQLSVNVASAMQYLHSRGIIHRDLTSRNVLIEITGARKRAVVADFGLATKIPDPNREFSLSVVGSPYWMAPECIAGHRYDESADVFSFGIIVCEIIARIDADPDELPRTQNFGLDYIAYSELVEDCPLHFLYLAFQCCLMEPKKRPRFSEVHECLIEISKMKQSFPEWTGIASTTYGAINQPVKSLAKRQHPFSHQRSYSEHALDLLKYDNQENTSPQVIGKQMTKVDPLYEPAPANTNPFVTNAQLYNCRKLVASDSEREHHFELSMTLPPEPRVDQSTSLRTQSKQCLSLPDSPGIVKRAIEQFNAQISSSNNQRLQQHYYSSKLTDSYNSDTPEFYQSTALITSYPGFSYTRQNSKQRNLKCAMLFCGLDLIQLNRATSSEWSDTQISSDLESEFQDDLEDVLRLSSSDAWDQEADYTLSPTPDSAFGDVESEWLDQPECSTHRYLHPTLVEKRRQLRHVESKQKEKLEQLQIKLDQLRLNVTKSSRKHR